MYTFIRYKLHMKRNVQFMYLIKQMSVFSGSTQPMPGFLLAGHTSPVEPGFLPGMDKCKQGKMEGPVLPTVSV